jgi:hypothetical protein
MAKLNVNQFDFSEIQHAGYEKFKPKKKNKVKEDILESSGKSDRGGKSDSHISKRTKARR